jgi:hypothetical protein
MAMINNMEAVNIASIVKSIFLVKDEEITDQKIRDSIENCISFYNIYHNTVFTQEDKDLIFRIIESTEKVKQDQGVHLVNNIYDKTWYSKLPLEPSYFWNRYKTLLIHKHYPTATIERLENDVLPSLIGSLGDPNSNDSFCRHGLVIGDVQSGKTSNYLALVSRAADVGYKVFIILTGTIEDLRRQTQSRVNEGFIGQSNNQLIGVGLIDNRGQVPLSLTTLENDFIQPIANTTALSSNSGPVILVIKKNVTILKRLVKSLESANRMSEDHNRKIPRPMLLIDDEADNASINTKNDDENPTQINKYIRQLMSLFSRCNYMGFTATPFANVFISPESRSAMLNDDLFPRDFIHSLSSPDNYVGPQSLFTSSGKYKWIVNTINDTDDSLFPLKHKKDFACNRLFESFYEAIYTFFIGNAIRDLRGDTKEHRSMLINVSPYKDVQKSIQTNVVEPFVGDLKRIIYLFSKKEPAEYMQNPNFQKMYTVWKKQFEGKLERNETWEKVVSVLYESTKDIVIETVNSNEKSRYRYDDYKDNGLRVIVIGGYALSRGMTLEGLMVSYLFRSTATFDVLLQMGRWFGYRFNYDDLCRVWLLKSTIDYFGEITESIALLNADMREMEKEHKTPLDFGIRVRNDSEDLGITARNKMRNTEGRVDQSRFFGCIYETAYLYDNKEINKKNYLAFQDFFQNNSNLLNDGQSNKFVPRNGILLSNVDKKDIVSLLNNLDIPSTDRYIGKQYVQFIQSVEDNTLDNWDVYIPSGFSKVANKMNLNNDYSIYLPERSFDITSEGLIRFEKRRARLGGPQDFGVGLDKDVYNKFAKPIEGEENKLSGGRKYLVEGRHPLLVIYLTHLIYTESKDEDIIYEKDRPFTEEIGKEYENYYCANNFPLIGILVGFPSNSKAENNPHWFMVNKVANYYDMHDDISDNNNDKQED